MVRYTKKKTYRKKRVKKPTVKRVQKATGFRPQRGMMPAIHPFKRQIPHQVVHLNRTPAEGGPGTGWDTSYQHLGFIGKFWKFKLADFNFGTDFTSLFQFYKLNAVSLKIYQATGATAATRNNSQCILTLVPDRSGQEIGYNPEGLECLQARKDRLLLNNTGKPHHIYMKLNQLGMVYGETTAVPPLSSTDYALRKPRFIHKSEPTCEHYGIWTYIRTVNGTSFDNIEIRIEPTIYLTCKQVQ